MKVLHIIPNLRKGGAERLVTDIVRELATREGIEVRLVLFRNEIEYDIEDIKDVVKIIPAKVELSLWKKNKLYVEKLQAYLDKYQPDIIHSHLFEAEIVSRSCYYPKAIWFSHGHSNIKIFNPAKLGHFLSKQRLIAMFEKKYIQERYSINGGTNFICISNDTLNYYKSFIKNYDTTLLPNAIDYKRFFSSEIKKTKELKLINVGSFQQKKNQKFIVLVAEELNRLGIKFHISFLGDGKIKPELEKLTKSKNLSNFINFHGNVNKVEYHLQNASIYIHSAYYEPFGLVLLEAMAAGLPVITLDGGGNRDLIEEGKNGYMIYNQDVTLFAEKIYTLWNDKEKMLEMSVYAQEYAKKYDIEQYVNKLLYLYNQQ